MYKFWYAARLKYPGSLQQAALNFIKFDHFIFYMGVKIKFSHPDFFGGLCAPTRDFNNKRSMI